MSVRLAKGELKVLERVHPIAQGRRFIAVGPHCWGRAETAIKAVKNAKSNRVQAYEPARGWCWALYDCDEGTRVEDCFGGFAYVPQEGVEPYRLVALFNMPPAHSGDPDGVVRG